MRFFVAALVIVFAFSGCDDSSGTSCTPQCEGMVCGDDGCGGSCGSCADETACSEGVCLPTTCEPGCTDGCPQGCFDLGACNATDGELTLLANIETVGAYLTIPGSSRSGELFYRRQGEERWFKGHDAAQIPDGRLVSSLFYTTPHTTYEVMMRAGESIGCATTTTLPLELAHETLARLYVDSEAAASGDGSEGSPFATISEAVEVAHPGTDIMVAAGIYHEAVALPVSGEEGRYIRILGEPGVILDGAIQEPALSWTSEGGDLYTTPLAGAPSYLLRDNARLYHYTSLSGLQSALGDDDVPMEEGWFVEGGLLWVRTLTAPHTSTWQIPDLNTGIALDGVTHIWIEGLTIRYYGEGEYAKGIDIRDSSHIVVQNNIIHDIPSPVWIRRQSHHNRVQGNEVYQTSIHLWPWDAVKGTDHENSAVTVAGGEGAIIWGNHIHEIFNGVYTGSFSDDQNPELAFDVDVYENTMVHVTDDGMEPEGACINNRFWENSVDQFHSGISLAPITWGPVWVVRNRFSHYTGSAFKFSNNSSGRVWAYHNTCFVDAEEMNGNGVSGYFENMVFRNNVFRGTRYAFEMSMEAGPNDFDFNCYYTTRGAPVVKWSDVRYDSVALWCDATGMECNGIDSDPRFVDPGSGDYSLEAGSPAVDGGERLYGVNDTYLGLHPDLGAIESH